MYNPFQLAQKYLGYYLTASSATGHGVHSPFVFDFIKNVLTDHQQYQCYPLIEKQRTLLKADDTMIEVEDFGAGSAHIKSNKRVVKHIAASSLKPAKYAQLLYRIVQYYRPDVMVELGTSFGITSSYLALGNPAGQLYTCEGSASIAAIAQMNFDALKLKNAELISGDFAKTLSPLLMQAGVIDLAFIDGNHRKEPTLSYFDELLKYAVNDTIFIFDDIHWSKEMEAAWQQVQQHPSVTLTIDLFFIGLVFIKVDFKVKQHFKIRF